MRPSMAAALAAALALAPAAPRPAAADEGANAAAVAAAALLALGVGVAIARHSDRHDHHAQWDDDYYGQAFHPADGVTCLPRPRKCYRNGHFSEKWTRRVFDY